MTRPAHIQPIATGGKPPEGKSIVPAAACGAVGWQASATSNSQIHSALKAPPISELVPIGDREEGLGRGFFGETFIEQRSITSYYTPYTFSAKERDTETGYSFFGARYYDADISVWLSVDPMADKYPSMSAYMYCAGNPVMLVDPDGMDIHVTGTEAAEAFKSLILGFKGVTQDNYLKAFNSGMKNHRYNASPLSKRKFRKNFKEVTGENLGIGKKFKEAYAIHEAMSDIKTIELSVFTGSDYKNNYNTRGVNGDRSTVKGTRMVKDKEGFSPTTNTNTELLGFYLAAENNANNETMNFVFDNAVAINSGENWKLIDYVCPENEKFKGANNIPSAHKGTIVINGNRASSIAQRRTAISDALRKSY